MSYQSTIDPIAGLEERSERVSKILITLKSLGFNDTVAFGEGLSQYLIGTQGKDEPIQIEADFPEKLKPGWFTNTFKTEAYVDLARSVNIIKALKPHIEHVPELARLSRSTPRFGEEFIIQTAGAEGHKIRINAAISDYNKNTRYSPKELLARQFGTMNKIAIHFDEAVGSVLTTRHPQWQKDAEGQKFRIPAEADFREINNSLAYYFRERSYGHDLGLIIDDAPTRSGDTLKIEKARYTFSIHRTALKVHEAMLADETHERDAPVDEALQFEEAANFMETICEHDPY